MAAALDDTWQNVDVSGDVPEDAPFPVALGPTVPKRTTAPGAVVTPDTLSHVQKRGLDPCDALRRHDSYSIFATLDELVTAGPTLNNVNEVGVILGA